MGVDTDQYWMTRAIALAERAGSAGEVPVGAVLVKDAQLLGEGWNQPVSRHDPTAHAEIIALRAAASKLKNYRIPGSTLYCTLEPCAMCAGAIVHTRIQRVVFATRDPRTGAAGSLCNLLQSSKLNHRCELCEGVLQQQSAALLSTFFQTRRAKARVIR